MTDWSLNQVSYPDAYVRQKEEIWLSPMTKAPKPTDMSKVHFVRIQNLSVMKLYSLHC